ncbi:MAG TPA: hypothetical protein VGH28_03800 [Polyangiaceae bacterium]|jgi:hypothetical protein
MRLAPFFAVVVLVAACGTKNFNGSDGGDASSGDGSLFGDAPAPDGAPACATGVYAAHQDPAAMLVLLQKSGSMLQGNKWVFAAQAIVQALDQSVFDTMTVGLIAAPNSAVAGPACIGGLTVACGVPAFPQVDLAFAGTSKSSDPTGVRHDIKTWLANNNAQDYGVGGEGNPLYSAIQASLGALQLWPGPGKRILLVVTDGAISCTSLSNRQAYNDGNGCPDWENPNNIVSLVNQANTNQATPIDTFVVGVPGSDSYDPTAQNYPPYHMRAALSDIAYAGSPANVPANCTHTNPFAQGDPDPAVSCHFDMTQNYSATQLASAIAQVRGAVLGCIFDVPVPDGGTVDPNEVNVSYSVGGGSPDDLFKRASASEDCSQTGCWDYTSDGKVELFGKACDDVKGATDADVEITVGCQTIVK